MEESELIFTLFYILLCFCIIYPPAEFVSLGWTLENLFSRYLGYEEGNFVRYHQKRTALTLFVHASLPGIYFVIYYIKFYFNSKDNNLSSHYDETITWNVSQRLSIFAIIFVFTTICYWTFDDFRNHPISRTLSKFSNADYRHVARDIENEFKRENALKMSVNSISSVITTENWIMKTTPYFVHFAHQSDTTLDVIKSETFNIAADTNDLLQMINIIVKPSRSGVKEFHIRIDALDFKTLQDCISIPITIPSNIHFHGNLIDRFIDAFKQQVALNPVVQINQIQIMNAGDNCFACMLNIPNIKIQKQCSDVDEYGNQLSNYDCCSNCYCRPMWCVDCLARWFSSRQDENESDAWLLKKCTCPLCRAKFCILDVCYIERIDV